MSIEKMREEFEVWYLAEYFESDKQCGLEWLSTEPCGGYRHSAPASAWKTWQASRADIEAPSFKKYSHDGFDYYDAEAVDNAISDLGLKVKS